MYSNRLIKRYNKQPVITDPVSFKWSARTCSHVTSWRRLLARLAAVLAEAWFIETVKVAVDLDVRAACELLLASFVVGACDTRVVVTVRAACTIHTRTVHLRPVVDSYAMANTIHHCIFLWLSLFAMKPEPRQRVGLTQCSTTLTQYKTRS